MPENVGDGCKKQGEPTMEFSLANLQPKERASFALRALYEAAGCRKYHMGRFEEYGLYQENRSFLSSEQVITFTDLDGRLLALKPDVTLSIAKTAQPAPGETLRYYYHENVYRPSAESHTFKEISQMGLEMLGAVGEAQVQQAVCLAARSLDALPVRPVRRAGRAGCRPRKAAGKAAGEKRPRAAGCSRSRRSCRCRRYPVQRAEPLRQLCRYPCKGRCSVPQ